MSADTVVGAITTEAAQEVADLLAEARRAAEAQLAAAREAVDAQVASACAVAEREARVEALRAMNAATLRLVRRRAELDDEQVDVVSKAMLGVTLACARCHDHKFDPFYTKDYYSMISIFASTRSFAAPGQGVSKLLFTKAAFEAFLHKHR